MPGSIECVHARDLSEAEALALAALHRLEWPPKDGRPMKDAVEEKARAYLARLGATGLSDSRPADFSGPAEIGGARAVERSQILAERAPRFFFVRGGTAVVAKVEVFPREIATSEGRLTIMGVAGLCVVPGLRGAGLGRALAEAAFALVDEGIFPAGLFQTTPAVRRFHEKLGACVVENRIVNSLAAWWGQRRGPDFAERPFRDGVVMRYPKSAHWPEGEIDLLGPGY